MNTEDSRHDPLAPISGTEPRLALHFSKKQLGLALAIAVVADAAGAFFALAPPVTWAIDAVTAVLLFAVLGWQWLLLPGLVMEAIPGLGVLPLWILVVLGVAVWGTPRPNFKGLGGGQVDPTEGLRKDR